MNTAVAVEPSNTVPPLVSSVQEIPLRNIQESKTNPRRQFDEAKLAELAGSVPRNKTGVMFRIRLCGLRENTAGQIYAIDLTNQSLESIRLATGRSEP
jgi:hypothetical protein